MGGQFTKRTVVARPQVKQRAAFGKRAVIPQKGAPGRYAGKLKGKIMGKAAEYSSSASCTDW